MKILIYMFYNIDSTLQMLDRDNGEISIRKLV